ncbi:hypothetical protein [Acinetobacter sp. ANC 4648]|uniref:hypothetical protein n=1 Tax=Acinetobacter sp. ANC 4648 TaxID=1977875 RepID=UPI001D17104D|nr:hypothetical protein [Acinetobacter sp. ANC 4648]
MTQFVHSLFNKNKSKEVFLGDEFDENSDEIENFPTEDQLLDECEKTYRAFLFKIEDHLHNIQKEAFERDQNCMRLIMKRLKNRVKTL